MINCHNYGHCLHTEAIAMFAGGGSLVLLQVKELAEECGNGGERLTLKIAKELCERAERHEQQLASLLGPNNAMITVLVSAAGPSRQCLKQACQQIVAVVEHEQKKTVWLPEFPEETQLSHV